MHESYDTEQSIFCHLLDWWWRTDVVDWSYPLAAPETRLFFI